MTLLPTYILSSDVFVTFLVELLYWFLKVRDLNFQCNPVLEISLVRCPNLARPH